MPAIRTTDRLNRKLGHDCDLVTIDDYSLREVRLPESFAPLDDAAGRRALRLGRETAIEVVIEGRNFALGAQPISAFVGNAPVHYLQVAPDERSLHGLLLQAPRKGSRVRVQVGDVDVVQHARPYDPASVDRIG
jgi:hypothetical protein